MPSSHPCLPGELTAVVERVLSAALAVPVSIGAAQLFPEWTTVYRCARTVTRSRRTVQCDCEAGPRLAAL